MHLIVWKRKRGFLTARSVLLSRRFAKLHCTTDCTAIRRCDWMLFQTVDTTRWARFWSPLIADTRSLKRVVRSCDYSANLMFYALHSCNAHRSMRQLRYLLARRRPSTNNIGLLGTGVNQTWENVTKQLCWLWTLISTRQDVVILLCYFARGSGGEVL